MDSNLRRAIQSANWAIEAILDTEFCGTHTTKAYTLIRVKQARGSLMDALDALSAYQAQMEE